MLRVDTRLHHAEVVEDKPIRNVSDKSFVHEAVRWFALAAPPCLSVAVGKVAAPDCCLPDPASVFVLDDSFVDDSGKFCSWLLPVTDDRREGCRCEVGRISVHLMGILPDRYLNLPQYRHHSDSSGGACTRSRITPNACKSYLIQGGVFL